MKSSEQLWGGITQNNNRLCENGRKKKSALFFCFFVFWKIRRPEIMDNRPACDLLKLHSRALMQRFNSIFLLSRVKVNKQAGFHVVSDLILSLGSNHALCFEQWTIWSFFVPQKLCVCFFYPLPLAFSPQMKNCRNKRNSITGLNAHRPLTGCERFAKCSWDRQQISQHNATSYLN